MRNSTLIGRVAAIAAVAIAIVAVAVIVLQNGTSYKVKAIFENASQIVSGDLPAIRDVLSGAGPLLGSLGPFLEQLNPILDWLAQHQQLTSDFISNGAAGIAAKTVSAGGGGLGHYLRQFSPVGPETLSLAPTRDSNNRGNTYPPPLWLADPRLFKLSNLPAWDCNNTSTGGPVPASGTPPTGTEACWVAPTLPGASPGKIPQITAAQYSSK